MSDPGLSRAQRAYDDAMPSDGSKCPQCVAEKWRQRVLSLLDEAPMYQADRELYMDRLEDLAEGVADDVEEFVELEDGEPCEKHKPKREDYDA